MCNLKSRQAFTLPEVVITSIVVLIMLIPISRIAYTTLTSTRYARDIGEALAVGQEKMEEFSGTAYADLAAGSETRGMYDLSWTVTVQNNAKIVQLDVEWDVLSQTRSVNLNSIYSDTVDGGFSLGLGL
ncbi:MAG: type IV pilus modification PilV family protein [Kiritimatiellia bacterium]